MKRNRVARKTSSGIRNVGNPFTLLAEAYKVGDITECLDLLTNIHVYLCRQVPPWSLRCQWRKELEGRVFVDRNGRVFSFAMKDFVIKNAHRHRDRDGKTRWGGCYFVRLHTNWGGKGIMEAWLDYSTEANAVGIDGFRSKIARRGMQLMGYREKAKS